MKAMKHAFALLGLGIMWFVAAPAHASDATATRDYAAARDAIVHHIDNLVPALAEKAHPQETLQGVITAIDERNDRISVRLVPDNNSEFKVQDGLIFNAIRNGDRVEITVENAGGAKTIVGLKKL
jgi:Cu/Ag efflux protein CusF